MEHGSLLQALRLSCQVPPGRGGSLRAFPVPGLHFPNGGDFYSALADSVAAGCSFEFSDQSRKPLEGSSVRQSQLHKDIIISPWLFHTAHSGASLPPTKPPAALLRARLTFPAARPSSF